MIRFIKRRKKTTIFIIAFVMLFLCCFTVSATSTDDLIYKENWAYQAIYELSKTSTLQNENIDQLQKGEPITWKNFQSTFVQLLKCFASTKVTEDHYQILEVTPQQTFYINKILSYISARNSNNDFNDIENSGQTLSDPLNFAYDSKIAENFVPVNDPTFTEYDLNDINSGSEYVMGLVDTQYRVKVVSDYSNSKNIEHASLSQINDTSQKIDIELTSETAKNVNDNSIKLSMPPNENAKKLDLSTKISLLDTIQISANIIKDDKDNLDSNMAVKVGIKIGEKDSSGVLLEHSFKDVDEISVSGQAAKDSTTYVNVAYVLPKITNENKYISKNKVTVNAGYGVLEKNKGAALSSSTLQSSTILGVDYDLALKNNLFFKAGYRYEKINDLNSSGSIITNSDYDILGSSFGLSLNDDFNRINATNATVKVTSVDIGYNISNNVSVVFGYNLIDFTDIEDLDLTKNKATAEITIKF